MSTLSRLRTLDGDVWRFATWAAPFTVQAVLGVAVGVTWLLGRSPSSLHGFSQYALGAGGTLLLAGVATGALLMRGSARAKGFAISIIGSFVVALIGATAYGFWIVGW
jgi:hypothetical protein